jgi:SIR2-like domain
MQFVTHGPDIPNTLLQAHEEGRVVFFCGAGISYPAGLPNFKGLVDEIYRRLGTVLEPNEKEAYARSQFDATLDLLERRLPGQRIAVRKALEQALKPKYRRKGATDTHVALLQLARCREGSLRLVTTNFDRVFERVGKSAKQLFCAYAAPMFPIPKNSRWDGLVYLHGLLPEVSDESALHRLVVTSGDFGLAYLTERWAARFVSELFRNYVVCFIGYSINDPVLRYMMDALAADRMLGEVTPQAYALGDCEAGQEKGKTIEWEAKGVTPILYEVPAGSDDHSVLRKTLKAWAETYRDGILGKEAIVVKYALTHPSASTRQDDFIGRMLWALSHESGLPAKRFAEFNPVPPLSWLETFCEDRYQHGDLNRFGVPPHPKVENKLQFSLIRRPAPYNRAPLMVLVSSGAAFSQWDGVMFHLARWLLRHLNDPVLVMWLAERGGRLNDQWTSMIEQELDRFSNLEHEGKTTDLDEIRSHAPNAIPNPMMRVLWRLLLTGRVKSPWHEVDIYRWKSRLARDGWTTTLRLELREMLAPKVVLKKLFRWGEDDDTNGEPTRIKHLVDWELVLAANHVHSSLQDLADECWRVTLPALLGDFQQLLRDALDLLRELGEDVEHIDRSHWDLPSISPHWQNRGFRDWVTLIELLRDAWLAIRDVDSDRAGLIARDWFDSPYSTFKRLALFAASKDDCIVPDQWVEWLVGDAAWWLWSMDTQRETMRLLALQSANLSTVAQQKLEAAILAGPPRKMYVDDIKPERWQSIVDRSIWLHLAKLKQGGGKLSDATAQCFDRLSAANPAWELESNESDEFSHWMSGTGDPDYEASHNVDIAPRKRRDLVNWLKQPRAERHSFYEDTWRETCRTRFFHSLFALCDLAREGVWLADRWRDALNTWGEEGKAPRSWRFAAPLVLTMPDNVLQEIVHGVTWWLEAASKLIDRHEKVLLDMCRRVLALQLESGSGITQNGKPINRPVTEAINHPVGHVTRAVLNVWFKREPNDNEKLPADIEPFFTQLCDASLERNRHGRVLLAAHLIALFRVDQSWTEARLLPFFNWTRSLEEARAAWEGFLWSPRVYWPLLIALKPDLLSTAGHYSDLGEHSSQFAVFLTYAALDPGGGYAPEDFQKAIGTLPREGLQEVAQALSQAIAGAGEQREDYWRNRIQTFWQQIWPKSRDLSSNHIAGSLARLCIAARDEFPSALSTVFHWLRPIEHPSSIVCLLHKSGLAAKFPHDTLRFFNAILDDQPWAPPELKQCLDEISGAAPEVVQEPLFVKLSEYIRRHGM